MVYDTKICWFIAQLKPNAYRIAAENLIRQGFQTFLPMHEVTERRNERFLTKIKQLFPGYMFVGFDPEKGGWRVINSTYGVSRLVSFSNQPAKVPSALIEGLRARCDEADQLQPQALPKIGEDVRISGGPFAEFVGKIENLDADQRVWILLDLMGQKTRVQIDATNLSDPA